MSRFITSIEMLQVSIIRLCGRADTFVQRHADCLPCVTMQKQKYQKLSPDASR
jgi:hypothetical protein